jgi:drug/metabolite transporter (DMT)-like permease
MTTAPIAIVVVLIAAFFGALGQYYFKLAADKLSGLRKNPLQLFVNFYLYAAIFLYGLATLMTLIVLPLGELSVLYPLVASSFIWVIIIAKFKLGEQINTWKILGVLSIIVGVVLTSI